HRAQGATQWEVAYLPIDPRDLGRRYEEVVRINSQSGKGGVALVLERDHGISLPKWLHPVVSDIVQREADRTGKEIASAEVRTLFDSELVAVPAGWRLVGYDSRSEQQRTVGNFRIATARGEVSLTGEGQGLVEALIDAIERRIDASLTVVAFEEHALESGTNAQALASVMVSVGVQQSAACWIDEDAAVATMQAVLSAVGRSGVELAADRRAAAV